MIIRVNNIMTKNVVTIDIKSDIQHLVKKMGDCAVGNIIVMNKDRPVGIVTEHDIFKKIVSENLKPSDISIAKLMTEPLETIPSSLSVEKAAHKMLELHIRRLPVMENAKLAGIVTDTDIMAHLPDIRDSFIQLKMGQLSNKFQAIMYKDSVESLPGISDTPPEELPGACIAPEEFPGPSEAPEEDIPGTPKSSHKKNPEAGESK